jgi:sugar lactone lactonase YvrE
VGAIGEFGEGPVWDSARSVLWWVDVFAGDVHCYDPSDGSDRRWNTGRVVASLTPRSDGTLLVSTPDGFGSLDLESGGIELVVPLETEVPTNRLNDGKVDSAGRFWAGTMDCNGDDGKGCLYRLDADLHCTQMLTGVTISNGIGWSPDDCLMYYVDTRTQRIDVFDFDQVAGLILNRRTLVEIPRRYGTPDGLTVDSQGYVWVAMFGGGAIHRYSPDGRLSAQVRLPVSNVTSCTFGGAGMNELYVTSTSQELEDAQRQEQPLAGSVFRVRSDTVGMVPAAFRG